MRTVEIDKYKVKINYPDLAIELNMDFEPIASQFNLDRYPNYVLCHWQIKPKGLRGFGWFTKVEGETQYHCIDWDKIECESTVLMQPLQINENIHSTLPTAVLLFPNAKIIKRNCWVLARAN
jgi:hypothetical protein